MFSFPATRGNMIQVNFANETFVVPKDMLADFVLEATAAFKHRNDTTDEQWDKVQQFHYDWDQYCVL